MLHLFPICSFSRCLVFGRPAEYHGVNVSRADRGDVPKGSAEIFFRKVKFWQGEEGEEAPPVFVGIRLWAIWDKFHPVSYIFNSNYVEVKRNSIFGV